MELYYTDVIMHKIMMNTYSSANATGGNYEKGIFIFDITHGTSGEPV